MQPGSSPIVHKKLNSIDRLLAHFWVFLDDYIVHRVDLPEKIYEHSLIGVILTIRCKYRMVNVFYHRYENEFLQDSSFGDLFLK